VCGHTPNTFSFLKSQFTHCAAVFDVVSSDYQSDDGFGNNVKIDGDTVAIGASYDDDSASSSGSIYIFVGTGTTWTEQAKLVASDPAAADYFSPKALEGDTLIAGGRHNGIGVGYVFVRTGTTWAQQAKLIGPSTSGTHFSLAAAISGDTVIMGAQSDTTEGYSQGGSAHIYVRTGTTWAQQQRIVPSDLNVQWYFGCAVALSGDTAIIGSWMANSDVGAAYVFVRSGTTWTEQQKLAGQVAAGQFGYSVALQDNEAIIGANANEAVYVFTRSGTIWTQQQTFVASDAVVGDSFGSGLALDGDTLLVGAEGYAGYGANSGLFYIFARSGSTWTQQQKLIASDSVAYGGTGEIFLS
jgi:hypothetical protein